MLKVMTSTDEEAMCLHDAGRANYKDGNYAVAIAQFTKALDLSNVSLVIKISILQNRAAAWEMIGGLENLEMALLDMRLIMSTLSQIQAECYLHVGKIHQLLNRDEPALETYTEGIKQVKPDMEHCRVWLSEKQFSSCDPLKRLPIEIAESILEYLTFQDLMVIQGVCSAWKSLIQARNKTFKCLDFSMTERYVSRFSLQAYINRSAGNVHAAKIGKFNHLSALSTIIDKCPQLSLLRTRNISFDNDVFPKEVMMAQNLTELSTDHHLHIDHLHEILAGCTSLHTLECGALLSAESRLAELQAKTFPSLRFLKIFNISSNTNSCDFNLAAIARSLPELEEVFIINTRFGAPPDFRSLKSLTVLRLIDTNITVFPPLPQSLKVLDLQEEENIGWSLPHITASPLPNLETLWVSGHTTIENAYLLAILAPSLEKDCLRSLNIDLCPRLDFHSLAWLVKRGENLEQLSIRRNITVTDETLKEITKFKKLRILDMQACPFISAIGLTHVLNGSPGALRRVYISQDYISDTDKAQLAAKSGVRIMDNCVW